MTTDQVLFGVGLILVLAVGSQVLASRLRIPALIILLPAGFTAGALTTDVNSDRLLGAAFQPLVSLAVAVILYDSGLALEWGKVTVRARRVVPGWSSGECRSRWRSPRCSPPRCWACRPGRRTDRMFLGPLAVHKVAVLRCCTAPDPAVRRRGHRLPISD